MIGEQTRQRTEPKPFQRDAMPSPGGVEFGAFLRLVGRWARPRGRRHPPQSV